jgi:hypothetical protein
MCKQEEDDWQDQIRAKEELDHPIESFEEDRNVGVGAGS